MAKKIQKTDLFADDLFKDINVGAEKFLQTAKEIEGTLRDNLEVTMKWLQGMKGLNKAQEINAVNQAFAQTNQQMELHNKLEVEANIVEQAQIKTKKDQLALQKEIAKQLKADTQEKEKLNSLYAQESKRLNELRKKYKDMALAEKESSKEAKVLLKEITALDSKLKRVDASVGQFQRNVGNYAGAIAGFGRQIRGLGGELLGLAGIATGTAIFTQAIDQIQKFDQSLADLRAILGVTANSPEFAFLQKQALDLGKTTTASASEVVEAYKLIGSAKPELLENVELLNKTTQAAITLADASGLELPDAATRLTDALNQFNASASESDRFINVLAAGAQAGSAEIPQVTDALLQFGTIAKNANVSVEESVGLIEAFAERGLKGAEAGTKLRNVLLNLSAVKALPREALNQLKQAGVDTDKLSDSSLSLEARLRELSKIQGNQTAIVKVFGKENAAAGNILLDNIDAVASYTQKVTDTTVAQAQAAERTDTLQGSLKKLSNAWQATVIEFGQGGGDIKGVIDFIRDNLSTIVAIAVKVAKTFIVYKGTILAVSTAMKVATIAQKTYELATKALTGGLGGALKAFKAMDNAMKATVIGAVVAGVYALVDALGFFETAADRAAASQERVNTALDNSQQSIDKAIQGYKDLVAEAERTAQRQIDILKAQGEDTTKLEEALRDKKVKILRDGLAEEQDARAKAGSKAADLEIELMGLREELASNENPFIEQILKSKIALANEELKIEKGKIKQLRTARKGLLEDIKDINTDEVVATIEAETGKSNATKAQLDERKRLMEKAFQDALDLLERERTRKNIEDEKTITDNDELNISKLENDEDYYNSKIKLEEKFGRDSLNTQLQSIQAEKKIQDDKLALTKKRLQQEREAFEQQRQLEIDLMDDGRDKEISQARADHSNRIEQLKKDGKLTTEVAALEEANLRKKLREINDKYDVEETNEALARIDAESAAEQVALDEEERRLQERLEKRKQFADKAVGLIENELEREAQLREDAINKNISRIEREIDRQQALAEKGRDNILAQKEAELAQEQLRLEEEKRRQLRQEKAIAFTRLVAGYADKRPGEALGLAIRDIALMEVVEAAFARGVENLKGPGSTVSDSIPARLSRGESVITADATDQVPGLPTALNRHGWDGLEEWAHQNLLPGMMISTGVTRGTGYDMTASAMLHQMVSINKRLESLEKTTRNKREMIVSMNEMGEFVVTTVEYGLKHVHRKQTRKPRI